MDRIERYLQTVWDKYYNLSQVESIITPAIPIPWFGDYEAYLSSSQKILTVSANPSKNELQNELGMVNVGLRFPMAVCLPGQHHLSTTDSDLLKKSLNRYYSYNPYWRWFSKWNDLLTEIDASYLTGEKNNIAIHIDLFCPAATNQMWSEVGTDQKKSIRKIIGNTFKELVDILAPDIVLSSKKEIFTVLKVQKKQRQLDVPFQYAIYTLPNGKISQIVYGKGIRTNRNEDYIRILKQ